MISTTDQFPFGLAAKPLSARLQGVLSANATRYASELAAWVAMPPNLLKPSEWLEQAEIYLEIDATRGRERWEKKWSFTGREYMREPIDLIDHPDRLFLTRCWGTGSGKTTADYGVILHDLFHNPFSGLYVMPAATGSGSASEIAHELIGILDGSPAFAPRLPTGLARKTGLTRTRIEFGGNNVWFVGGHSTSKLGGKRCRLVFVGEQDKTKESLGQEASADYLAGERTKGMSNSLIIRSSSPSVEGKGIWKALMGGGEASGSDCRRRFLPCPHCNASAERGARSAESEKIPHSAITIPHLKGWFVLIKDARYNTALPTKLPDGTPIPFAEMKWDKEAKRKDGSWDMDRVIASTRFECPHCGGHVRDEHRLWMDKHGVWIPTRVGEKGHFGHQLSSYYAPLMRDEFGRVDFKTKFGGMAQKFLTALENGTIGGYINSDLAEVNASQNITNQIEVASAPLSQADWIPILTADFQKNHPFLWFVVRQWCAFKLHPPGGITAGVPDFVRQLDKPGNEVEKKICTALAGGFAPAWQTVGELLRFEDPRGSAVLEFLLAQGITGRRLHDFYRERANGLTLDFRRALYRELSLHQSGGKDTQLIRAPRGGDSELVAAGYCDHSGEYAWDELREYIQHFQIGRGMPLPGRCVGVDCGYAEKFHREVLQHCHESGTQYKFYDPTVKSRPPVFFKTPRGVSLPVQADGWFAMRGKPSNKPLGEGRFNHELNTNLEDPYFGTAKTGEVLVEVLEFPSGLFWNHKQNLRLARTKNTYSVSPKAEFFPKIHTLDGTPTAESRFGLADYQKHLNEQFYNERTGKVEPRHGRGGSQSRAHPYHLDDCENENLALATYNEFFDSNPQKT